MIVFALLLWSGVVAWELLVVNGYRLEALGSQVRFLAAHAALDFLLLVPLFAAILFLAVRLTKRFAPGRNRIPAATLAALSSILILIALGPVSAIRIVAHEGIDAQGAISATGAIERAGSYCTFGTDPGAPLTSGEAATSPRDTFATLLAQGFRAALMDQALLVPLLFMLCLVWAALPRARQAVTIAHRKRRRLALGVGALAGAAALVAIGGSLIDGKNTRNSGQAPRKNAHRTFNISAIPITMTLNRFGDHDPDAFMYVLDERIPAVRAEEGRTGSDKVTIGLRQDSIQPLVIRANLGETIRINFTNRLDDGPASLHLHGLPHTVENAGGQVGLNPNTTARPGETITYTIEIPTDVTAERAYYFRDHGASRQRVVRGLFGALVAEPAGSIHYDVETGEVLTANNWEAIIAPPIGPAFREYVLMYHEVGDENFDGILDVNGRSLPVTDQITETYRPSSRAINYRSESFHNRLALKKDKSQGYGSYMFGDPATPIPRSYLGEPTKTRLMHGGSEIFHVHHLHGGGDRWRRNPKADPNNDISSGLTKRPQQNIFSTHLDSQSIGPGTSYNLEHEGGAGGVQQAAGDFLYHCHIGHHYLAGMWSFWRVFDTEQSDLFPVMGIDPPAPVPSSLLAGKIIEGKTLVPAADLTDPSTEQSLEEWIERQLPPKGLPLDDGDATVWNWELIYTDDGLPVYFGEPETTEVWPNYASTHPGERPVINFNPNNGRYAWPLMRPHLGQRPPFSANGHSGAPWLGERGSALRPDGLWPDNDVVPNPDFQVRQYPITAISTPVRKTPTEFDEEGMVFVLGDEKDEVLAGTRPAQPLVIRSNVGDGTRVILTSEIEGTNPGNNNERTNAGEEFSKVNMHIHFVQFDPQASDGVITGMSYEQSVRPYATEGRTLLSGTAIGTTTIEVDHLNRLRPGIWIGIGLGEGMAGERMVTEIRKIEDLVGNTMIVLNEPLDLEHAAGEAVGVEFVQYAWYSDVDTGTVFWHDHVNFKSWDHGLFGAHIIEPAGSSYHDPISGNEVRSGPIVDIHAPPGSSVGHGQSGSFREFVAVTHNRTGGDFGADLVDSGGSINLAADPLAERGGNPAHLFSSITHGDPITPLPRAYVGDPFVIRHLGVVERVGGLRVTGHRFKIERWGAGGAISDTSPLGISERFDLILEGGAGGPGGFAGDYLYYSSVGRDFMAGAWGIIRVQDNFDQTLQPLPDRPEPPATPGLPGEPGDEPIFATDPGNPGSEGDPVRRYEVEVTEALIVTSENPLRYYKGIAYIPKPADPADLEYVDGLPIVREPLVIRVNAGEVLEIDLTNKLNQRASISASELLFDPKGSYGPAIGNNPDSSTLPGETRTYRFFADRELGSSYFLNLANVYSLGDGAFGGIVVEPADSVHLDPYTGEEITHGLAANIIAPSGNFREFVTLYHDVDRVIGQSRMPYPRDVTGFTGINYAAENLHDRLMADALSQVFNSIEHGDPRLVFEAHTGDPVTFRVAAPWAEQMHTFAMEGHRWPLDPGMVGSEQIYANILAPGYSFDAPLVDGAGGGAPGAGDHLFQDGRLPFLEAGLWGILAVEEPSYPGLQRLGLEDSDNPVVKQRGEELASRYQVETKYQQDLLDKEAHDISPVVIHSEFASVELEPGADRGFITLPLRKAYITSTGELGWFVLSDASDEEFAKAEGCLWARGLGESHPDAIEDAVFRNGAWEFSNDAGLVVHFDENDQLVPPSGNPDYSPIKRILWNGREIIVNAPLVKWGDAPGQQMRIDQGGIDPLIRNNPPSPLYVGGGPQGATPDEEPIERYEGGQVVALNIPPEAETMIDPRGVASVTMKAQIAIHRRDFFAYYVVFEASKPPPAGFMGVPYAPKLGFLSTATDELWNNNRGFTKALGHIMQFRNGVTTSAGGPKRFQPGLTSYASPEVNDYSPMWHITWLFWDSDGDGIFYNEDVNRSFGAAPMPGSGIPNFDPASPLSFDPFGMDDKGIDCTQFAIEQTGNSDGRIYLGELAALLASGVLVETQAPAGWDGTKLGPEGNQTHPLNHPLIVNCPTHVVVDYRNVAIPELVNQVPEISSLDWVGESLQIRFKFGSTTGNDPGSTGPILTAELLEDYQLEFSVDLVNWHRYSGEMTIRNDSILCLLPAESAEKLFVRVRLK
ncbi:MAG: multicopper oxidase domain-containing protein [Roseibacillus sp.]